MKTVLSLLICRNYGNINSRKQGLRKPDVIRNNGKIKRAGSFHKYFFFSFIKRSICYDKFDASVLLSPSFRRFTAFRATRLIKIYFSCKYNTKWHLPSPGQWGWGRGAHRTSRWAQWRRRPCRPQHCPSTRWKPSDPKEPPLDCRWERKLKSNKYQLDFIYHLKTETLSFWESA